MSGPALQWPDLVWSHFSRPRFDPFPARFAAAGAAGFAGVGIYAHAYGQWKADGHDAAELRDLLVANGLVLAEAEAMRGWWADSGAAAEEAAMVEAWTVELAEAIGVRYLQVIGSYECPFDVAVHRFGALCDRAAEHDVLVGIEWLPFTNIKNADDARRIVEAADRPNGGYCVDIWHHVRGVNDRSLIRALDASKVFAVQMNDGLTRPTLDDYKADCLASRLPPGEGEFDCASFLRMLHHMGVTAPLSLEVCSPAMWEAPVDVAAQRCADAMRAVLASMSVAT